MAFPYQILWSPQALEDLKDLTAYISIDNPQAARKLGLAIIERVESLATHPRMGRIVPERKVNSIREILVGNYRIIYRVQRKTKTIEVWRIWHGARGIPEI